MYHLNLQNTASLFEELNRKKSRPLSLQDLLRSKAEEAYGLAIRNIDSEQVQSVLRFSVEKDLPITLFCFCLYDADTMRAIRNTKQVSLFTDASFLCRSFEMEDYSHMKMQAIYLDIPWTKDLANLLRLCKTRVVLTDNEALLREIAAAGFYGIKVLELGGSDRSKLNTEIPINKSVPVSSFPVSARLSMLCRDEELYSLEFSCSYRISTGQYCLSAEIPFVKETPLCLSENALWEVRNSIEKGDPVLISGEETLFLYGIHEEMGCFIAMNEAWRQVLVSESALSRIIQAKGVFINRLYYVPEEPLLKGNYLNTALHEETPNTGDLLQGRSAAVRYLNTFVASEGWESILSLRCFVEERFLVANTLVYYASIENLYIDSLEEHISMLDRWLKPILDEVVRDAEITSSRHLQWGNTLQRIFASEERCLGEFTQERQRIVLYNSWVEELRKKS